MKLVLNFNFSGFCHHQSDLEKIFFIVGQLQLFPFSPHYSPLPYPSPTSHIQSSPHHCHLCPWVRSVCSLTCSFPFSPHFPLALSPPITVSLFFISTSLVIFCLLACFVNQVPLIGEISFSSWLVSLSIMLFSSIHAVTMGRSSFCCIVFHCVNLPQFFDPLIY